MSQKGVLLLSGASMFLLTPPAIATQPTEAIPDATAAIEADLQTPEPTAVEMQVAQPEQIVEAPDSVAPTPTVSPPEPFAPDFSVYSAPTPEAIAPVSLEPTKAIIEPITGGVARLPEQVEKLDKPTPGAVSEAISAIPPKTLAGVPEEVELTELEELDEPVEQEDAGFEAIAPITESPGEQSNSLPDRSLNEASDDPSSELGNSLSDELSNGRSPEFDNEQPGLLNLDNEVPDESLDVSGDELSEQTPRLYGEPEPEADIVDRLVQDNLDQLTPDEWVDLLLGEENDVATENATENRGGLPADPAVPEPSQEASEFSQAESAVPALNQETPEFSQAEFEAESSLQRDVALDADPQMPRSDLPQPSDSASSNPTHSESTDTHSDSESGEGLPEYRLVVGDRLVFNVKPYSFNWVASNSSDSIRKQKLRRSPEVSPTSKTGISAGIGFNLLISNQAKLQFTYGAQSANDPKLETVSSVQPALETLPVQDNQLIADKPVKADKPREKTDPVERTELTEGSDPDRAIATPNLSTDAAASTSSEANRAATPKTQKTHTGEPSQPAYNFNRAFAWQIAPNITLNTWGGLTLANPFPPDSPIFSLTYLFYLGFPDPLDQDGDRLIFMVGQPPRLTDGRG